MIQIRNKVRTMAIVATALGMALPALSRADVFVIVNASGNLTVDDIKLVYTGDKELIGSVKIKPVDNHASQSEFLSKVLSLNANRYESLWTMKCFRDGLSTPSVKSSDADVIAYVLATPGAVGYITSAPPAGVVVLKKF